MPTGIGGCLTHFFGLTFGNVLFTLGAVNSIDGCSPQRELIFLRGRRNSPLLFTRGGVLLLQHSMIKATHSLIPTDRIEQRIYFLRGEKVMLSTDLASLYQVAPRVLVQAVKRNTERFPKDFMFQLTKDEFLNLKSQIVTSRWGGLRRATPYAFTEQGVAMLSSILRSKRAVRVNIEIMRAFVRLRKLLASNEELAHKLELLEKKYDAQFKVVFEAIRELMTPPEPKRRPIGFGRESE